AHASVGPREGNGGTCSFQRWRLMRRLPARRCVPSDRAISSAATASWIRKMQFRQLLYSNISCLARSVLSMIETRAFNTITYLIHELGFATVRPGQGTDRRASLARRDQVQSSFPANRTGLVSGGPPGSWYWYSRVQGRRTSPLDEALKDSTCATESQPWSKA